MQSTREQEIVAAATGLFSRYGFRKVTMSDIAQAAHISRPTLYACFPNKEAAFRACAQRLLDDQLQRIRAIAEEGLPLVDALSHILEIWVVENWNQMQRTPDLRELTEGETAISADVVAALVEGFEALLIERFAQASARPREELALLARTLIGAMRGLKSNATTETELRAQLGTFIDLVVHRLEPSPAAKATPRKQERTRS